MNPILNTALLIVQLFLGLTIVIILHEFGHFFVARAFGVKSEEIGLGLPPRIAYIGKFLDTPMSINWLPFGAFVRIRDESGTGTAPDGLYSVSPIKRILIFLAGPAVNLVVSFILLSVVTAALGIPDNTRLEAFGIIQGTPADIAGIRSGDTITAVNGIPFESYEVFHQAIQDNLGKEITLTISRNNGEQTFVTKLTPRVSPPDRQGPIGLGVRSAKKSASFLEIITGTAQAFGDYVKNLFEIIGRLVTGTAGANDQLVGFKGMFDVYSYTQSQDVTAAIPGWVTALNFFGLISASLGIVNLLPIPALDGGRIFLSLPELMFRVKIPRKVETAITIAGFILLMLLMLYINVKDFIKPIPLPGS
jgi:regulator of sigma E protease